MRPNCQKKLSLVTSSQKAKTSKTKRGIMKATPETWFFSSRFIVAKKLIVFSVWYHVEIKLEKCYVACFMV